MRTTADKRKTQRIEIIRWEVGGAPEFQYLDQGDDVYIESDSTEHNETDTKCEQNQILIKRQKADCIPSFLK
jgi:hypothetical protein